MEQQKAASNLTSNPCNFGVCCTVFGYVTTFHARHARKNPRGTSPPLAIPPLPCQHARHVGARSRLGSPAALPTAAVVCFFPRFFQATTMAPALSAGSPVKVEASVLAASRLAELHPSTLAPPQHCCTAARALLLLKATGSAAPTDTVRRGCAGVNVKAHVDSRVLPERSAANMAACRHRIFTKSDLLRVCMSLAHVSLRQDGAVQNTF